MKLPSKLAQIYLTKFSRIGMYIFWNKVDFHQKEKLEVRVENKIQIPIFNYHVRFLKAHGNFLLCRAITIYDPPLLHSASGILPTA